MIKELKTDVNEYVFDFFNPKEKVNLQKRTRLLNKLKVIGAVIVLVFTFGNVNAFKSEPKKPNVKFIYNEKGELVSIKEDSSQYIYNKEKWQRK